MFILKFISNRKLPKKDYCNRLHIITLLPLFPLSSFLGFLGLSGNANIIIA